MKNLDFLKYLRAQEDAAYERIKPVPIEKDLDGGEYRYRFFRIGQVSVSFRYVKGELI